MPKVPHHQNSQQPQQKRKRGRPRKNSVPTTELGDSSGSAVPQPSTSDTERTGQPFLRRNRSHLRNHHRSPTLAVEELLPEDDVADGFKERTILIEQSVPPLRKGTFCGLQMRDRIPYDILQIEKIQGDPEETVYLTDSDEDVDETTDVEDGGFEGAEERRREDAPAEAELQRTAEYSERYRLHRQYFLVQDREEANIHGSQFLLEGRQPGPEGH